MVAVAETHAGDHGCLLLRLNEFVVLFLRLGVLVHHGDLGFALLRNLDLMNGFGFERGLSQAEFPDFFNVADAGDQRLFPLEFSVTGIFIALGYSLLVLEKVGRLLLKLPEQVAHLLEIFVNLAH